MNYLDFCEKVKKAVSEYYGDTAEVSLREVVKNNGLILQGLSVRDSAKKIAPTIYLERFYDEYEKGNTFSLVIKELISFFDAHMDNNIDMEYYAEYQLVKENITYKLINAQMNTKLLREVPHILWNDLAIVFCYMVKMEKDDMGTILVSNNHIQMWNVDKEELFAEADKNTRRLCGEQIVNIRNILEELCSASEDEYPSMYVPEMFVLSNNRKLLGASALLYSEKIKELAESYECNLFIIPSSIHEVILLPEKLQCDTVYIRQMIKDVNENEVCLEERLSDSLYYYNYKTGEISIYEEAYDAVPTGQSEAVPV